jgi:hypothetical protein
VRSERLFPGQYHEVGARKQAVNDVLSNGSTETVSDLLSRQLTTMLYVSRDTNLQRVKDDVELNGVLSSDGMIYFAKQ